MHSKASDIRKALAAGHSCEQILARDRTLTYHDIFHAVAEVPTSHWAKNRARKKGTAPPPPSEPVRRLVRHLVD